MSDVGNERQLALQGFVVDNIEELGVPWLGMSMDSKISRVDTLGYLSSTKLMCLISVTRNHPIYATEEGRAQAEWRIPIADLTTMVKDDTGLQYMARASVECEKGFNRVRLHEERHQELTLVSEEQRKGMGEWRGQDLQQNEAYHYWAAMTRLMKKRPFVTRLGYVGLGPAFAKAGDKVVVFKGGAIPFVVRPTNEGKFQFLGEAYCDCIMDGEIVDKRAEEQLVLV